jgi:pimeloyl-ACP methyl ester carboxylesterase
MKTIRIIGVLMAYLSLTCFCIGQGEVKSETYKLMNDSIQIPGTLSYRTNLKKQPLVIFVHGSGNVDRNGNQQGANINANYIKQLAEALNKNGIAFYRYDKRTSTSANMKFLLNGISLEDFVDDVKVAISNFEDDPRFSSITLIGHSQGSLVAMLALNDTVEKYISIAGPSKSIDKTIIEQIRTQNGDSIANIFGAHFKELKSNGSIAKVDPIAFSLLNPMNQSFFKSWMLYEPTDVIAALNTPTLIINGTKDLQVSVEEANDLHRAYPNSKLIIIDQMNHVLKTISQEEDNLKSYYNEEFPLSENLVTAITEFIKK